MRVEDIIGERLEIHTDLSRGAIRMRVEAVLDLVGLAPDVAPLFPHEFSGGQRQRIAIARPSPPTRDSSCWTSAQDVRDTAADALEIFEGDRAEE